MVTFTQDIFTDKRIHYAVALLVLCGAAAAGWFGYTWYRRTQEQAAFKDLAESIEGYIKAQQAGSETVLADVARAFTVGAQRHAGSQLQSYFLVYQADMLARQGKLEEAIVLMDKSFEKINREQPLYYAYAIKRALMKLDADNTALQKQGRTELEALAHDSANPVQDMALYYKGLDAEYREDQVDAHKQYQEIIGHGNQASYWYQLAHAKLES